MRRLQRSLAIWPKTSSRCTGSTLKVGYFPPPIAARGAVKVVRRARHLPLVGMEALRKLAPLGAGDHEVWGMR